MNKLVSVIVVLVSLACTTIYAQPARNATERSQDQREGRQDNRQAVDDRHDYQQLIHILQRFDHARAIHNIAGLNAVDRDLRILLSNELAEGRMEMAQDKNEVARSNSEVRSDRREEARDYSQPTAPGVRADDRHDARDDRRDRADDQRDLGVETRQQHQKRAIAAELNTLYGRQDPNALTRKRALIIELSELARAEVHQDAQEKKEDNREIREDRRETREDRRQP